MIVTCPNCTTRLQLEASKVPSRAFSVRCPKCQHIVTAQPPALSSQRDAVTAVSDPPASSRQQQVGGATAAATPAASEPQPQDVASEETDVLRMLASLLRREGMASADSLRNGVERKRALVCAGAAGGEVVRALSRAGYDVMAPNNVTQAGEVLREGNVGVVVLDPEFDASGRGASFICGELLAMRMPERRRVVFVQMSGTARTGDAHAAFAAGANLVVNTKDALELPRALERNIRDLNELYRDFNKALGVSEL